MGTLTFGTLGTEILATGTLAFGTLAPETFATETLFIGTIALGTLALETIGPKHSFKNHMLLKQWLEEH